MSLAEVQDERVRLLNDLQTNARELRLLGAPVADRFEYHGIVHALELSPDCRESAEARHQAADWLEECAADLRAEGRVMVPE